MAKKKRKIKNRIRVKQSARLVHKNDKTRVARRDELDSLPRVQGRPPANNAPTLKIKIRKK